MNQAQFVHLNVHTEYSIVDSTVRIPQLIKQVKDLGMPAVAMTDGNNVFAAVKFFNAAKKAGIKPLIGADVWVVDPDQPEQIFEVTLICQDRTGYLNLSKLISHGQYHRNAQHLPTIDLPYLFAHHEGLIALADSMTSDVGIAIQDQQLEQAVECMLRWKGVFQDRYYMAIAEVGRDQEQAVNSSVIYMAAHQSVPLVATGRCRFLSATDFNAHEARICINRGYVLADPKRPKEYTPEQYLKSPKQMTEQFAAYPQFVAK